MIIKTGSIVYDKDKTSYKIIAFVDNGSFGSVYKIENESDKSMWALKTLPENYEREDILKGLINEGKLAIKISHPNVIKYLFFHDGSLFNTLPPYIIMEFAEQGTLKEFIENQKEKNDFIPNKELHAYFTQLIDGMEAINLYLIHRDIKPDNILIKNNLLKISDFGLSKIVQEQTRTYTFKGCGHIRYLSPEGWKSEKNTIQMDIYSMGIVFYELATLTHPLKIAHEDNFLEWQEAHIFQNPQMPEKINPKISPVSSQVIQKMLEKSISKRFTKWEEIRQHLNKDIMPSTSSATLVENVLKKRLEKDTITKTEQLKIAKRQEELNELKKLVKYQIEEAIIKPLQSFIDEFNAKYLGNKIRINHKGCNAYEIALGTGYFLFLDIEKLKDEDFIRQRQIDNYGDLRLVTRLERPVLNNKKIIAWGYFRNQFDKGFNIVLAEKAEEIYGEWFVLINTNSALSGKRRPVEPFAFKYDELEREIKHINAMHIYNTKVEPLKLEHFTKFIE